jgi:ABC-type nitrate/sulfonate/bicarbonate transport system substrate-binding protein
MVKTVILGILLMSLMSVDRALADAPKVAVGHPGYTASLPVLVAREKGYYRDLGLDVDLVLMRAVVASRALIGKNVNFVSLGGAALTPIVQGTPLRIVFTFINKPMFYLYSHSDITTVAQLKGKKVGIGGVGGGPADVLAKVLRTHGLDPGRNVAFLTVGGTAERFAALVSNGVDAAILGFPFNFRAEDLGLRELISFAKQDVVELNGNIVVTESFLRSEPEVVESFIRATLQGHLFIRNNRSETVRIIARYQKIHHDLATKFYDRNLKDGLTYDGTVDERSQRVALEPIVELLRLPYTPELTRIFDYTITRKAGSQLGLSTNVGR